MATASFKPAVAVRPRRVIEEQPVTVNRLGTRPTPKEAEEKIDCVIPRNFTLTDDDGQEHKYRQGRAMMPRSHALHFYSKANGVTPFVG